MAEKMIKIMFFTASEYEFVDAFASAHFPGSVLVSVERAGDFSVAFGRRRVTHVGTAR